MLSTATIFIEYYQATYVDTTANGGATSVRITRLGSNQANVSQGVNDLLSEGTCRVPRARRKCGIGSVTHHPGHDSY